MNRRGSALLTVLWLVVILSTAGATVLSEARLSHATTANRLILRRAEWAAEACVEVLKGRFEQNHQRGASHRPTSIDTLFVDKDTWCLADVRGAAARMDLLALTPGLLPRVLPSQSLIDAFLDWCDPDTVPRAFGAEQAWYRRAGRPVPRDGPLADIAELALVRGFDQRLVHYLDSLFTVGGAVAIDPNEAPRELLSLVPGLDAPAVEAVLRSRASRKRLESMEEFMQALPPLSRDHAAEQYLELSQHLDLADAVMHVEVEAGVVGWASHARIVLELQVAAGRLAVLRRRPG